MLGNWRISVPYQDGACAGRVTGGWRRFGAATDAEVRDAIIRLSKSPVSIREQGVTGEGQ